MIGSDLMTDFGSRPQNPICLTHGPFGSAGLEIGEGEFTVQQGGEGAEELGRLEIGDPSGGWLGGRDGLEAIGADCKQEQQPQEESAENIQKLFHTEASS